MTQLDLFGDRAVRLAPARRALERLDFDAALAALRPLAVAYARDDDVQRELASIESLASRLAELAVAKRDSIEALLAIRDELPDRFARAWHRRIAREIEAQFGLGAFVDGEPAGAHHLAAGDFNAAVQSLQATASRNPNDARSRARLGDALFLSGDREHARHEYLVAFASAPHWVRLDVLADPNVAGLATMARYEYEVPGDPVEWIAAVGTVTGVFAWPASRLPGVVPSQTDVSVPDTAGASFYRALIEERAARTLDERVAFRRQMKKICPLLLEAYLARR